MHVPLVPVAALVAVVAALRSLWSPCGLSMLSTITPLAERRSTFNTVTELTNRIKQQARQA